jgi:hypothetical protein
VENLNSIQVLFNATVQGESLIQVCRQVIIPLVNPVIRLVLHVHLIRIYVVLNALQILSRFSKRLDSLVNVKQDILKIPLTVYVNLKKYPRVPNSTTVMMTMKNSVLIVMLHVKPVLDLLKKHLCQNIVLHVEVNMHIYGTKNGTTVAFILENTSL